MNDTIRALEREISLLNEEVLSLEKKRVSLEDSLVEARKALVQPGKRLIVKGAAGNLLATGRILSPNQFTGQGMIAIVTREGDIRMWQEKALMDLNLEIQE